MACHDLLLYDNPLISTTYHRHAPTISVQPLPVSH